MEPVIGKEKINRLPRLNYVFPLPSMFQAIRHTRDGAIAALLVLLIFQAVGWLMAWLLLEQEARQQAAAACQQPSTNLRAMTMSRADFAAARVEDREVWLDGALYDIAWSELRGDSIALRLYYDAEEQGLQTMLHQQLDSDKPISGNPTNHWLVQWLSTAFLLPEPIHYSMPIQALDHSKRIFAALTWQAQAAPDRFSPPPEALACSVFSSRPV